MITINVMLERQGAIPEKFLKQCAVPSVPRFDDFITLDVLGQQVVFKVMGIVWDLDKCGTQATVWVRQEKTI